MFNSLGGKISVLRKEAGFTQAQMAEKIGMGRPSLVKQIADYYGAYLMQFEKRCLPKVVLDKMGQPLDFPTVMAKSSDKLSKDSQLSDFLKLLVNIKR